MFASIVIPVYNESTCLEENLRVFVEVLGAKFGDPGNHFRLGFGRTDLPVAVDRLEAFARRTLR